MRREHRTTTAWAARALAGILCIAGLVGCDSEEEVQSSAELGDDSILSYFRASAHKTLDPQQQFDQASAEIISNVYDTLLEYHYLDRPYRLVPGLLEKMPEKLEDGLSYRLTLRRGVRFMDDPAFPDGAGRELTVDDIIYTFKRFADARVNNKSYVLMQGFVAGLDAFREATKTAGEDFDTDSHMIEGLEKIDSHSMILRFTQKNPLAFFPLATSQMSIVAKEAVEHYGEDFGNNPVGTGPFFIKEYARRGTIVLKRNPDYFGRYPSEGAPGDAEKDLLDDQGKQLPLLEEVHLPLIEEAQPAMLKFKSGEIDWVGINKDDFVTMAFRDADGMFRLQEEFADQFKIYNEPGLSAEYLAFNLKDPLLGANKALRQAFAYAMDVPGYIELLLNGRALPLKTIVPQPIAGSERDIETVYYEYDPKKAKEKLAEAGYPDGAGLPPITVDIRAASKSARDGFEYIRAKLAEVGITVKGNFQTFSAFLKRVETGNFQMTESGWQADFPDGENFFQLLYGPNEVPGPNITGFADPEYDRLFEQARFMENGPERFALFRAMAEILREEVPIILMFNGIRVGLHQKNLRNLKRNIMIDAPYKYLNKVPSSQPTTD